MKNIFRRLLGVLAIALWAVPCAQGQQIPPVTEGDPIVRTTLTNGKLTMIDLENEHPVILPASVTFRNFDPAITGDVRLQEQPDGFDLVYTFTNTGAQPARLGRLNVGKFNLGRNIFWRDYRYTGGPRSVDWNTYSFQAFKYPSQIYSPVWTLYNDDYAVSISLQYPIMDYQHEARIMLGTTPAGEDPIYGPRGWYLEYKLANFENDNPGPLRYPGAIPAGETRTYVVSVRVTKNTNEWIRTLTPYRDYFRSMYGGVQYDRDTRPIHPILTSLSSHINDSNPYGFDNKRPDLNGYRAWTDQLKREAAKWQRVMIWTPTGQYNENQHMNFPYEFTTRWLENEHMADAIDDEVGFPSVARAGVTVGLWWGRALQVSRAWNSGQYEDFDPDNPAHVRSAFAEMDLAVRAGATEIGLDTFTAAHTPIWKLAPWLQRLREAYPGVRFCIEPVTNDILHRLGPTYVIGWNVGPFETPEDLRAINNPFYLADLLLPGHESWGAYSYHRHRAPGFPVTPEIVRADAERLAAFGFVPLMYQDYPHPETIEVAESWLTTLPADMLRGSGWNQNHAGPRAYRRPDGRLVIIGEGGAPPRTRGPGGRVSGGPGGPIANPPNPSPEPGVIGDNGVQNSDEGGNGDDGIAADTPVKDRTPIARAHRKYNVNLRIQRHTDPDGANDSNNWTRTEDFDLPGTRAGIAVPKSAAARGKGGKGSNPAWLEVLARKGYMNKSQINKAVKNLPSNDGPAKVVHGKK